MKLIKGQYVDAKVMQDELDDNCCQQIQDICNDPSFEGSKISIMPDCHSGKGCVIGFTSKVSNGRIIPNLVGVDISCMVSGLQVKSLSEVNDKLLEKLDNVIRMHVPSGHSVRDKVSPLLSLDRFFVDQVKEVCRLIGDDDRLDYYLRSVGSLGGGNHFISLDKDNQGQFWLQLHSGSRNFGKRICEYFEKVAESNKQEDYKGQPYLDGQDALNYLYCMDVARKFAHLNHCVMSDEICKGMGWEIDDHIETNHNYVERSLDNPNEIVIRKGAISAKKDELILIPLNMKDGTLVCKGKGNPDWNESGPHGAGRLLSRGAAKRNLSLDEYRNVMSEANIWSSCISENTLDEAPMAYKDPNQIEKYVQESVDIVNRLTPAYNYKAN